MYVCMCIYMIILMYKQTKQKTKKILKQANCM